MNYFLPSEFLVAACSFHVYTQNCVFKGDDSFLMLINYTWVCNLQETEVPHRHNIEFGPNYWERSSTVPLLDAELASRVKGEQSGKSCGFLVRKTVLTSRTLVFVITGFAVCLGLCATFLHPRKVGEFALTIRRCLFDKT